jgi:preprotein translocase subunit YajC
MFKHLLESIKDLNLLAIIPLVLFLAIFLFATISVMRKKQDYIDKMASLPFDEKIETDQNEMNHE